MPVLVGTSGWQYRHWRERFYPRRLPQRSWLDHYTERFQVVELNNSFYRLPAPETFQGWAARTPDDFLFAVKASRFITHIRRLRNADDAIARFMDHASRLGDKLGPVLIQLPPNLQADNNSLDAALRAFPRGTRVAVEFRHESWFTPDTRRVLERRRAALCMADRLSRPVTPIWRTTDWTFLRFHEGRAQPHPCYGRTSLSSWCDRIGEQWRDSNDILVFFNNDGRACALRDAVRFARYAEKAGFTVTRVPSESVAVG